MEALAQARAGAGLKPAATDDRPSAVVADVAMFFGERSGGIRTYLENKARVAAATGLFEHHMIVPGRHDREAACVVDPGTHETFGLVVFEAAASGARVVAADSTPSTRVANGLIETFRGEDVDDMVRAIERALARPDRSEAAAALAERSRWERVFEDELAALERLPRPVPA